ncbi:MAG: hypothetical protein K8I02_12040 [Candidatus Methylomirabilis sp.]|nr:hypothetical protein [Deltaproteobacteria bacterium]
MRARIRKRRPAAALAAALLALASPVAAEEGVLPVKNGDGLITVNFREVEIGEALRALSRSRGMNLVMSGNVKGLITVALSKVSLEQALDAIVRVSGYNYASREGTVYVLDPRDKATLPKDLYGTEFAAIPLNYIPAKSVLPHVEPLLSTVGRATVSEEARLLAIEDKPDAIARVRRLLESLDAMPRQVFIEAAILEVTIGQNQDFGVDINYKDAGDRFGQIFGDDATGSLLTQGFAQAAAGGAPGAFLAFSNNNVEVLVNALQKKSETKTLAHPRVLALDGKESEIIIGRKLGFRDTTTVTDTSAVQSVSFLETGTQLRLTPTIAGDGYVRMDIHPKVSDGSVDTASGLPSETTTEVTTSLVIRDGETVVIGGLLRESASTTEDQVPYLGDIPLLGWLFQGWFEANRRTEIIVIVTPHIVKPENRDYAKADAEMADKIRDSLDHEAYR